MAQLVKFLLHKHEGLSSILRTHEEKTLDMVGHACNPPHWTIPGAPLASLVYLVSSRPTRDSTSNKDVHNIIPWTPPIHTQVKEGDTLIKHN